MIGGGTESNASATTRTISASVYSVSATTTLIGFRIRVPRMLGSTTNNANDGIVYSNPATVIRVAYDQR